MRFRKLLPVFLALCPILLSYSDTVMVHLRVTDDSDFYYQAGIDYARAIEDGVMDVFFDAGHIVFNFGIPPTVLLEPPFASERPAVRAAKAGGASHLIELELARPVVDRLVPIRVAYIYSDIIEKRILSEGTVRYEEIDDQDLHDLLELCKIFGQYVARTALNE